jgi:hypothetical protein
MRFAIIYLAIGELIYLLVAPPRLLQASYAKAQVAPHPRAVMLGMMAYCVIFWPLFAFALIVGASCAVLRGFRGVK